MTEQRERLLERRLQTLIGAVALALLYWVFNSVQQLEVIVGKQSVHIESLIKKTDNLQLLH